MEKIEFKVNKSKLKNRNEYFNNRSLNNLVNSLLNNENSYIFIDDIKDFFNSTSFKNYTKKLERKTLLYKYDESLNKYLTDFKKIASYFNSFENIWDEGEIGKLKGTFLELFAYKYLELKYPNSKIYRESRMFYKKFISSLILDVVAKIGNEKIEIYECKFSSRGFKRNYLGGIQIILLLFNFDFI